MSGRRDGMAGGGRLRKTGRKGFGAAGSHTLRWQPLFRGKGKMERVGREGRRKFLKDGWKSNGWMGRVGGGGPCCIGRQRVQRHLYLGRLPIPVRIQRVFLLTRESSTLEKGLASDDGRVIGRDWRDWRGTDENEERVASESTLTNEEEIKTSIPGKVEKL